MKTTHEAIYSLRLSIELRAGHDISSRCPPVHPLLQLCPHCRGGNVLNCNKLLDSEDFASDVRTVSVVDCLQSPVDTKRLEGALDVLGQGNGRPTEGDTEVGERLG